MKKLTYHISFSEEIDDPSMIEPEQITKITQELNRYIYKYLSLAGIWTDGIKIEFDLEDIE